MNHGKSYAGGDHTLHITENGRVKSAGACGLGWSGMHYLYPSLFQFQQVYFPHPENNPVNQIVKVYASYCHNLALGKRGTLYSWGCGNFDYVNHNLSGYVNDDAGIIQALGQGKHASDTGDNPKEVHLPLKKDKNGDREYIVDISGGVLHSAVLLNTGRVLTFGQNAYGELGHSSWRNYEPKEASVPSINGKKQKIVKLGPAYHNTFAISSDGKLFCAGRNKDEQCGQGPNMLKSLSHVKELNDEVVDQVEGGFCHTLVKTVSGKVYTLGCQSNGQRGVILPENGQKLPVVTQVELPTEAKQIAAGNFHNVVLGKDGNVYTFGIDQCGQCSGGPGIIFGEESNRGLYVQMVRKPIPTKLKLPENAGNIINVSAGYNHTVLDSDTGKTFAFGDNTMGQLGFGGDGYERDSPMKVEPIDTANYE